MRAAGGRGAATGAADRSGRLVLALRGARVLAWELDGESGRVCFHLPPEELEAMGFQPHHLPATRSAWLSQIHPDDRAAVEAALERALEGREPLDVEYRAVLTGAPDAVRWLATRGHPAPGGGMVGVTLDITPRKRAEEDARAGQEALRAVFSASPDLINILDPDGRVRLASPAVEKVLGYDPVREQGGTTLEWVHPDDRAAVARALARVSCGDQPEALERFRYRRVDGSWRVLESHGRRMVDAEGRPAGVVVVSRDVTERVQMEEELRHAKEEAERSSRAKSAFLSRMSHELRTPLNAVIGFAQLLELETERAEDRESAREILRAGRHLLGLIDDVLDAARIEAGRLRVAAEWISLDELAREAIRMIAPLARERRLSLRCGEAPGVEVRADPQRLRQVLLNLLSNAVKFTPPGGRVELRCARLEGRARLAVADSGCGMSPEQSARLFRPFERLDADERGIQGTGLGLALSRGLVEAMGGTLAVESRAGEGSTFVVELPARDASPEPERMEPAPRSPTRRPRGRVEILCVEGDPADRRLAERLLGGREGVSLRLAGSAAEGAEALERGLPDVLLLALELPGDGAEEVLDRLRSVDPGGAVRVLALAPDDAPETRVRLLELGVDAYAARPLDVSLLLRTLESLLAPVAA